MRIRYQRSQKQFCSLEISSARASISSLKDLAYSDGEVDESSNSEASSIISAGIEPFKQPHISQLDFEKRIDKKAMIFHFSTIFVFVEDATVTSVFKMISGVQLEFPHNMHTFSDEAIHFSLQSFVRAIHHML